MMANLYSKVMKTSDGTIMCTQQARGYKGMSPGNSGYVTLMQEESFGEDGTLTQQKV